MDKTKLCEMLNKALSDEWLAFYQYWIGAKVLQGPLKEETLKELNEHAEDEKRHAGMIVDIILKLNGIPVLTPEDWFKLTNCGYDSPNNPETKSILEQNIKGERCAINTYKILLNYIKDEDEIYSIIKEIYEDEIEHEEDLKKIFNNLK